MKCPACNRLVENETQCPRCSSDLSACLSVDEKVRSTLNSALGDLKKLQGEMALNMARKSYNLRHSSIAAKVSFVSSLVSSHNESLKKWWFIANREEKTDHK